MAETKGGWPAFSMPLLEQMETVGSSTYMIFWSLIKVISNPFRNFVFALADVLMPCGFALCTPATGHEYI